MELKKQTIDDYIKSIPKERQEAVAKLCGEIKRNLPRGFEEGIGYGVIAYFVPFTLYPAGYHANPKQPLPFINVASQKNFIAVYHMGIYASPQLLKWFTTEYEKAGVGKLDMGKSCIRFKKPENIPFKLMGELASKITVEDWIAAYEKNRKR
ncbi:MAG TPA: DUF1801 domain-containing protein [Chitinophagaceae bacterium]|nr:DUF1801 domain-containing protein [Chitinophagaceae bacterium]